MSLVIHQLDVNKRAERKRFIKSQWAFYKNDPKWVPPLIAEKLGDMDPSKNPFYKHSEIQLFLAERNGKTAGRIAAIVNYNHNKTHNDKLGFFGYFECEDNQETADKLFDEAAKWLRTKGMDTMRGPENPSMNDEIGLLIDGYELPPLILMTYNPKYYLKLIENNGFEKSKDIYAYWLQEGYESEKLLRLKDLISKRFDIKYREVNTKNKDQFKKYINSIKEVYNSAWEPNWGFVKWTDEEMDHLAVGLKQIADTKTAIIMDINGELAGFGIGLPDINQCLIHNKSGSLLGALWHIVTKKKKINAARIIALGIIPKYQNYGLDAVLYYELGHRCINQGYINGEASWVLEDNEKMNRAATQTMNGKLYKKYRLFDKKI